MPAIAALLRPTLYDVPVAFEVRVTSEPFTMLVFQAGDPDQLQQIMRMTQIDFFLVGKFVPPSSLCDASFERALDRVSGQVVRTVVQTKVQSRALIIALDQSTHRYRFAS